MTRLAARVTRLLLALAPLVGAALPAVAAEKFIVHEWGVLVTGGAAAGEPMELSAPDELYTTLPPFVLRHDVAYKPRRQDHGWDKPVLHFYGPENLKITAQVGTPVGKPLAYWPQPDRFMEKMGRQIASRREQMIYSVSEATGMIWTGTLTSEPQHAAAPVEASHWWSVVRGVKEAKWFNTAKQSERFIFYEASARQQPVVTTSLSADSLTIRNAGVSGSGKVVVLVNDGVKRSMVMIDDIAAGREVRLSKGDVLNKPAGDEQVLSACKAQWESLGMTETEAAAIVQTWKPDLLNRVGILVCAQMPDVTYGLMFPLTIQPRPDELVRAGLVLDVLPGQSSRLAWLPGLQKTLERWGEDLGDANFRKREAAAARFVKLGDLAKPYLEKLTRSANPEISRAAAVIAERFNPPATQPAEKEPAGVARPARLAR